MGILGFLVLVLVAALCAWIGNYYMRGRIPGGFVAAGIVGFIGAWLSTAVFGDLGPLVGGVAVIPAIVGSGILVFALSLLAKVMVGR